MDLFPYEKPIEIELVCLYRLVFFLQVRLCLTKTCRCDVCARRHTVTTAVRGPQTDGYRDGMALAHFCVETVL